MTTSLLSSPLRLRLASGHVAALVGLAGLVAASSARASVPSLTPDTVVAGDTYSIEAVGFNTTAPTQDIYIIQTNLTPTFGTTTAYAADALGGQTLTVTSSETMTGGFTTDTISFTVPTNFVPAGTVDNAGNTLNAIQFSIGIELGGTNPLDLTTAVTGYRALGTITSKNSAGMTTTSSAAATLAQSNGNMAFSSFGQTISAGDISNNQITGLTLTITNAPVPEPSTNAAVLLGAAGLVGMFVVRNRRRARA